MRRILGHPRTRLGRMAAVAAAAIVGLSSATVSAANTVLPLPFTCVPLGTAINGEGFSFQSSGVYAAIAAYAAACSSGPVTYTNWGWIYPDFVSRAVQFAGTDIPYTDEQWATMQVGGATNGATNASHVETIPIALGAVAVAVHEPCAANAYVTGTMIGQIYAGKITTWDQVVSGCPTDPIVPLHLSRDSAATATFKAYLTKKDPVDFNTTCGGGTCYKDFSVFWPYDSSVFSLTCGWSTPTTQALVSCLNAVPGGIAYLDETDPHTTGEPILNVDNAGGSLLDMLDLAGLHSVGAIIGNSSVPGVGGPAYALPVFGFSEPAAGQCQLAALTSATPTTTAADWADVDVTDSPNGYGICAYTYQLAWDLAVTSGAATIQQAITIRDFLSFETSGIGQSIFAGDGYDPLPPQVQALAYAGAMAF